uniref:Protein TIC 20 n=1 Tax=Oryza glumipatula TaxID=40148 RepID=A0A0E0ALL1_9ORYZ
MRIPATVGADLQIGEKRTLSAIASLPPRLGGSAHRFLSPANTRVGGSGLLSPKRHLGSVMVLCQGLSAGHAQLLAFPAAKHNVSFARTSCLGTPAGSLSVKRARLHAERKSFSMGALRVGTGFVQNDMLASFGRDDSIKGIPSLAARHSQHRRLEVGCRASSLASFSYPELTSKPRWWWRTLACVPYLLPLHNMWSYADVIYQLHTYLQGFSLVYTFIDTMTLFPGWLLLVIFMTVYFFVVRRKWSPHFLRFHVILAILLDTGSQAVATMCTWMPSIVYQGKPMQYFWMAIAFIQIFTVLECMRCALAGMYPNVPFISHTAFIHSDLNLFR